MSYWDKLPAEMHHEIYKQEHRINLKKCLKEIKLLDAKKRILHTLSLLKYAPYQEHVQSILLENYFEIVHEIATLKVKI